MMNLHSKFSYPRHKKEKEIPSPSKMITRKCNKPRLLLGLYAQPDQPNNPHYALLVTPKFPPSMHRNPGDKEEEPIAGTKYHVRRSRLNLQGELFKPWELERVNFPDIDRDPGLLVCTVIGKVLDIRMVAETISSMPIYQLNHPHQDKALNFDDHMWTRDAYESLKIHGYVAGLDWRTVEGGTNAFMRQKHSDDPWAVTNDGRNLPFVPIVDLISGSMLRM